MQFQKQLQDKLGEHDPNEVDELILDDLFENVESFTDDHKKTLELYDNLVHLSLNGFGLKTLKNFPKLPSLVKLEVRNNKLNGSDLNTLVELYPSLYKLKIGANQIAKVDVLKPLSKLKELKKIEVSETDFSKSPKYREELFAAITSLEVIDGKDKKGEEIETTLIDEEDEDLGDDEDGEFDENELEEDEDDFDDEDDDDEEEEPKPKGKKKH